VRTEGVNTQAPKGFGECCKILGRATETKCALPYSESHRNWTEGMHGQATLLATILLI